MSHPVFISYARDASRAHAVALHEALGPETAFLDTEEIGVGDPFPERLVDALFDARVVVIFAEPSYFTRRYCLYEFNVACEPYLRAAERPGATDAEKEAALRGIVLALPPRGVDPMLERFPPGIQGINWPSVDNPAEVAALVRRELDANPPTLRERYQTLGDDAAERAKLLAATRLPTPLRIGRIPLVPVDRLAPSIGDAFVGRADDIWRIHHVLTSRNGGGWTVAGLTASLEAGGGFGKTRLALEYLYRLATRHFRGGLFWINADADAELQLYDVLLALNPGAPAIAAVRETPGAVRAAVARAIRALPEDAPPPLFIVDNVPEPPPGEPPQPLDTWCPVLGEVPVLATSRRRVSLGSGGSVTALPIDTLDPDSAILLLTRDVSRDALAEDEWKQIADWVGHLPLALELLHGLLSTGAMPARAVLEMSRTERPSEAMDRGMDAIRASVPTGSLRGITEAFAASYGRLTPEQQYAARLIAWMAPEPIPEFVVEAFGPDVFTPSVRATLRDRSFVTGVPGGEHFGAMHRVLADFVLSRSPAPADEPATVSAVLASLMDAAEGQGDAGAKRIREIAPLVSAHFAHQRALGGGDDAAGKAWQFATDAGARLARWGYPELAGDLFESTMRWSAAHFGKDHSRTLMAANNLAITLRDRGHHARARELRKQVLDTLRRVQGEEHLHTLAAMHNVAVTLEDRGDLAEAQELKERVLEARRRLLGEEHPDTLDSLHNLANTLRRRGDLAGAQALQERVLEASERTLGEEHPDTLTAMNNLAITREERGDLAGAHELKERVLEAMRRVLGEEHPHTLAAMSNLAIAREERGDLAGAQELKERVLEARRRVLGEEHPDTLGAMDNLGITLWSRGDHAGARELQERVLEARRRLLGEEHPDTLVTMNNLAIVRGALGDHAGARELHERVVAARRRLLGEEHPLTLASLGNLAATLGAQGDLAEAQRLRERALEGLRRRLGVEHPWTTTAAWGLRATYLARGDAGAADRVVEECLAWLLDREPGSLGGQQQQFRSELEKLVRAPPEADDGAGEARAGGR